MTNKTFAIKSFGCKVNQYEEQLLRENLKKNGFIEADAEHADIFILNSCTVTGQADKKALRLLKSVKRTNPGVQIVFTGCLAVLDEDIDRLKILSEIDTIVLNPDKMKIPVMLKTENSLNQEYISSFESHSRAFVKIQDGCDQSCSFCKVTLVRGKSVSREISSIIDEIQMLLANGYREIVLTGICIGLWRGEKGEKLSDLLEKLIQIDKDFRIRISSIEPNHIDRNIIALMASTGKICKHLHLPLQSGSDYILKSMNRKYLTSDFSAIINEIREKIYPVGISLDVIAGFPGETDREYNESLEFIKAINPSRLHVFRYSDRKGTRSYCFKDKIPQTIAKERVNKMIIYGINMQKAFHEKLIGKSLEVLIEEKLKDGFFEGYSSEYARVRLSGQETGVGNLVKFTPKKFDPANICLF